jgi:hypothetical protein
MWTMLPVQTLLRSIETASFTACLSRFRLGPMMSVRSSSPVEASGI